jgi:hypothetical protein
MTPAAEGLANVALFNEDLTGRQERGHDRAEKEERQGGCDH